MDLSNKDDQDFLVRKAIANILGENEIFHTADDIQRIISVTNILYDRGWNYSYDDIAKFLTQKKSKEVIAKYGLSKAIELIPNMKMPPRRALKKVGRNEPCPCESGKKYKQCCQLKLE